MPTASTIKLPVLAAAFHRAEQGLLDFDKRIELTTSGRVAGSGVLKELMPGVAPTVRDYAVLMIIVSDNLATNVLVDGLGGVDSINQTLKTEFGLTAMRLNHKVTLGSSTVSSVGARPLGQTTARELRDLVGRIWHRSLVSAHADQQMLDILSRQQHLDHVPRLLDYDPVEVDLGRDQPLAVACKTGAIDGTRADVGLLRFTDTAVSYAVMTEQSTDAAMYPDQEGMLTNARVGQLLVQNFWNAQSQPPLRRLSAT